MKKEVTRDLRICIISYGIFINLSYRAGVNSLVISLNCTYLFLIRLDH